MEELNFFKYENKDDLYAASLGINSIDWTETSTKEFSENKREVISKMLLNRFDILPAKGKTGNFDFYISTTSWGYFHEECILQKKIDFNEDVIYYLTHVRDVLRLMQDKNRYFYFLSNHSEVIGLITIANFNDKNFYFWIYKKLVKLEKGLAVFIKTSHSNQKIVEVVKEFSQKENVLEGYYTKVLTRFYEDQEKGSDADIIEYLYFRQLCDIIIFLRLYTEIGLTKSDFESGLGKLNDVRNLVAHPLRSLINTSDDLQGLWKGIKKMDELIKSVKSYHEI